jgi:hypothetical protein
MTKKRALIILALAMLIAVAGVVYAHWQETLTVNATATLGGIPTHWKWVFTDDDGVANINDGEPAASQLYTYGAPTSNDPSSASGLMGTDPNWGLTPPTRYDKDVADCIAEIDVADAHGFTLTISNAYPSYHCTILSTLGNQGTVPVKVQAIRTTLTLNTAPFFPPGTVGNDFVATWDTLAGHSCGEQIDPAAFNTTVATIHFGELAPQYGTLVMHQEIDLVNWNEWSRDACSMTLNGVALPW